MLAHNAAANIVADSVVVWSDDAYQQTNTFDLWVPLDSVKKHQRQAVPPTEVTQNKSDSRQQQGRVVGKDVSPVSQKAWAPNAQRALWLGVIVPGAGQVYNRQVWKLPIIYGAAVGCAYAISWNGRRYNDYKQAYIDIQLTTDYTNPDASFIKLLPEGYTVESLGGVSNYTNILNNRQNTYRRNRDLGIIAAIAVYALSLIDAYVDAQLFNFDISPDLSLNVEPQINYDYMNNRSTELHLSFNF